MLLFFAGNLTSVFAGGICPLNSVTFECENAGTSVCVCDEGETSPQCLGMVPNAVSGRPISDQLTSPFFTLYCSTRHDPHLQNSSGSIVMVVD